MVGVPVIINHKDLTDDNVDDERVGVVNSVWYDEKDGWYWCDGIIWNETAQNLITDKNWSVSCSYDVKTANDEGGSENNIKYDMEFLDGVFTHLALVNNPRYERANIVFNAKMSSAKGNTEMIENEKDENNGEKGKWVTIKGTHVFIPDGKTVDEVIKEKFEKQAKSYDEVIEHAQKQLELVESKLKEKNSPEKHEKLVGDKIDLEDKIKYYKSQKGEDKKEPSETNSQKDFKNHLDRIEKQIKKYNLEPKQEEELLDELGSFEAKLDEGLEPREEEKLREELLDFEEDIKRHHEMKKDESKDKQSLDKKVDNAKEQDMALIEELKKLITKVENEKGDDMADDKEKNEVENENVDKRKLIDEVGGILKGKVDDEVIRTIIGKLEKVAYDKSEAGTADNEKEEDDKKDEAENCKKVKNEDDEKEAEDLEKDEKKDVENKCKNSVDNSKTDFFKKLNEIYNSASKAKEDTGYVSRADREKAAEDYFAR